MIADRYLERRFREGYSVGFKEGYAEGKAEIYQRIRQILAYPPTELTPEMRDGLTRALAELEKAPVPSNGGCCRHCHGI